MVEASKGLVCVLLNESKAEEKQYKIEGYPTVLFVDPKEETAIEELGSRDAKSVAEQMKKHATGGKKKEEKKPGKKK